MKRANGTTRRLVATVTMLLVFGTAGLAVASRSDDIEVERHHVVATRCDREHEMPRSGLGSGQTIVVSVPRTTFLKVDARGRITAAATNTGCAPRVGDDVYVISPDGRVALTTSVRLERIEWKGDFSKSADFQRQNGETRIH